MACGGDLAAPDQARDSALTFYAPGLELGAPARDAGDERYRFAVAPYVGYADTSYRGPDTFGALYLGLTNTSSSARRYTLVGTRAALTRTSAESTALVMAHAYSGARRSRPG